MGKADGCLKGVGFSRPAALGISRTILPREGACRERSRSEGRHFQRTLFYIFSGRRVVDLSTRNVRWQLLEARAEVCGPAWSRSQRQRCRLTWLPLQVKLHRLHQAAVAPSPHRQARAWPKSTRSCPRTERVRHRRRRRTPLHRRSTCKLSRRGWCTREDTERSTSLSSLPPSPRLSGSSTLGQITVAGPHAPDLPAQHTAHRYTSSAHDPPLGARAGSPTRHRRSSLSSRRTSR